MSDILGYIFIIALFWFVLYWVLGGVIFASIAIINVVKLRRARFSTIFTLLSLLSAFCAAYSGAFYAREAVDECLASSADPFSDLAAIVGCGVLEQMAAGAIWFVILMGVGLVFFILSRATNQSWIDSDYGLEEERYDIIEV